MYHRLSRTTNGLKKVEIGFRRSFDDFEKPISSSFANLHLPVVMKIVVEMGKEFMQLRIFFLYRNKITYDNLMRPIRGMVPRICCTPFLRAR